MLKKNGVDSQKLVKTIDRMAEYILETDKEKEWCNMDNCDYKNSQCAKECIIRYFSKDCIDIL